MNHVRTNVKHGVANTLNQYRPLLTGTLSERMGGLAPAIYYAGFFCVLGLVMLPLAVETRGRDLPEEKPTHPPGTVSMNSPRA